MFTQRPQSVSLGIEKPAFNRPKSGLLIDVFYVTKCHKFVQTPRKPTTGKDTSLIVRLVCGPFLYLPQHAEAHTPPQEGHTFSVTLLSGTSQGESVFSIELSRPGRDKGTARRLGSCRG